MKIFNTLTGEKEEFSPQRDEIKMYVCGVTPYDHSHVGHAMSYIVFDVIKRYLTFKGYRVRHVQNFTDVDDKIIARSQRLGISATELADQYIQTYFKDMDSLNIEPAEVYPRVTGEIDEIIRLVQTVMDNGFAYGSGGDVYFRASRFEGYGKLSGRTLEGMLAGARVEVSETKEHPMDFVLWKGAKPGEPAWDSPWGKGRPGWHIECSAMALKYLGAPLDIHGGGQDLIFPHHENEIAQSEAATGVVPFANYWVHNGLLQLGEEKMSKSLGNLVTIDEVLEQVSPDGLRLFVLSSHYHGPLNYTDDAMASWERGAQRLREAAKLGSRGAKESSVEISSYRQRFEEAMDDDFNSPKAIAVLFDLVKEINRGRERGEDLSPAQETLTSLATVLGLTLKETSRDNTHDSAPFIELLLDLRTDLRKAKAYDLADKVRDKLGELGVIVEDSPQGTSWKQK